jgi:hypothetical protein
MANTLTGFIQIMQKIDSIYANRLQQIQQVFVKAGQDMLADFQSAQFNATHEPAGKSKRKTKKSSGKSEDMAAALAYAAAHASDPPCETRGVPWINRTFFAAKGVHPYVNADSDTITDTITVGLFHTKPYGAYLEYGHNRKYAVLEPIVRSYAPKIMEEVKRIMGAR